MKRADIEDGDRIVLDPAHDPVFLNVDNPTSTTGVQHYERLIEAGRKLDPIGVVYIKVTPSILFELGTSGLEPLVGQRAKPGDWIFVVTNGHHRAIASANLSVSILARVVRVL